MYMAIAIFFILTVTAMIVYGTHYECEHFDDNHKKKTRKRAKARVRAGK